MVPLVTTKCFLRPILRATSLSQWNKISFGINSFYSTHAYFHSASIRLCQQSPKENVPIETTTAAPKSVGPGKGFVPVYKFPYIRHVQFLCRAKLMQTAFTVIGIPAVFAMSNIAPTETELLFVLGTSSLAIVMLSVMGEIFRKFVGFVYYNPSNDQVCVAHMTFLGLRKNSYHDLEDIVALDDVEPNVKDIYVTMKFYSNPSISYWLNLRFGKILNEEYFKLVMGCDPQKLK